MNLDVGWECIRCNRGTSKETLDKVLPALAARVVGGAIGIVVKTLEKEAVLDAPFLSSVEEHQQRLSGVRCPFGGHIATDEAMGACTKWLGCIAVLHELATVGAAGVVERADAQSFLQALESKSILAVLCDDALAVKFVKLNSVVVRPAALHACTRQMKVFAQLVITEPSMHTFRVISSAHLTVD